MPGVNIKKDDTVRVMTGKDRGKQGRVIHVQPREGRIMVDGVGPTAATSASTRTPRCSSTTRCNRGARASLVRWGASYATASSCGSCRWRRRCSR